MFHDITGNSRNYIMTNNVSNAYTPFTQIVKEFLIRIIHALQNSWFEQYRLQESMNTNVLDYAENQLDELDIKCPKYVNNYIFDMKANRLAILKHTDICFATIMYGRFHSEMEGCVENGTG